MAGEEKIIYVFDDFSEDAPSLAAQIIKEEGISHVLRQYLPACFWLLKMQH